MSRANPGIPLPNASARRRFWPTLCTYITVFVIISMPVFVFVMGLAVVLGLVVQGAPGFRAALSIWPWAISVVCSTALGAAVRGAWRKSRESEPR